MIRPNNGFYLDELGHERNVVEPITGGFKGINTDHAAIHKGLGYRVHLFHASLAQGAKKVYRVKGPTTKFAHIKSIVVNSEGATISVKLLRGVTITVAGTELETITNMNDNATDVNELRVFEDSTYNGGSVWSMIVANGDTAGTGVDANRSRTAGSFIQSEYLEYVTKSGGAEYIIEVENIDSKANPALSTSIDMFFYEEPYGLVE